MIRKNTCQHKTFTEKDFFIYLLYMCNVFQNLDEIPMNVYNSLYRKHYGYKKNDEKTKISPKYY